MLYAPCAGSFWVEFSFKGFTLVVEPKCILAVKDFILFAAVLFSGGFEVLETALLFPFRYV